MATLTETSTRAGGMTKDEKFVIFASSLGTVFEWYDFYLYGSLAGIATLMCSSFRDVRIRCRRRRSRGCGEGGAR